jgi:hypothetical protein
MDMEEEIAAFGETAVWITCDVNGRVYGGPDIDKTMARVGEANICVDCLNKWGTSAEGGHRGPRLASHLQIPHN